jgi:excisionase family DNA binding protein
MRTLTTIPLRRPAPIPARTPARPVFLAIRHRGAHRGLGAARPLGAHEPVHGFTPLIDAKAAGELLGVPHTWLLAQARAGRIPHHRLGHYVRFNTEDMKQWLIENRITPEPSRHARAGGGF